MAACHNGNNKVGLILEANLKVENIPINGEQSIDFNDVWDIISINPLETSSNSLIGLLHKVIVKNSKIYILSSGNSNNIRIFSLEGKFLRSLDRSGKGPGEYIVIEDFFVDRNGNIEILDPRGKKLIAYDDSLNFINERTLPFFAFNFIKDDGFYWFYTGTSYNEGQSFKLFVMDSSLTSIEKQYFPFAETELKYLNFSDQKNFGFSDDKIHFQYSYNDTIYQIEKDELKRVKYINFNEKNMPKNFIDKSYVDVIEFLEKSRSSNYAYWIDGYTEGGKISLFSFNYKDKRYHAYLKSSGEVLIGNTLNNYLGIEGYNEAVHRFNLPIFTDGEHFYFLVNAIELKTKVRELLSSGDLNHTNRKNAMLDLIGSSNINDNPIIVKLRARN